jgi:hypothetical protein
MPKALTNASVERHELEELIRHQEHLERRMEQLQRSLDATRSDLIRVALAVESGAEATSA